MKIEEIEAGKNVSDVIVRVLSVAPPHMVSTRGGRKTQLTEVLIADETGTVILSLWGFKAGKDLSASKIIKITDGWAKEWRGKIQLSLGRAGSFEELSDDTLLPSIKELQELTNKRDPRD
ncbi:MAG: hypothetical protein ACTSUO_07410 [Candidatus Thorarchaeota archaeon]